jgi:hypothetical protein
MLIGLSYNADGLVTALGEVESRTDDTILFNCINDGWRGQYCITDETMSFVGAHEDDNPLENVKLIWQGEWANGMHDYNDMINFINGSML